MIRSPGNVLVRSSPRTSAPATGRTGPLTAGATTPERRPSEYIKSQFDEMLLGRMGRYELAALTFTTGLLLAVAWTALEVSLLGGHGLTARDILTATGLTALMTVPTTAIVVVLLIAILGLLDWRGDRRWWTTLLTTLCIPVLSVATLGMIDGALQARLIVLAAVVLLPLSMIVYVMLSRRKLATEFGQMVGFHLIVIAGLLCGTCTAAVAFGWTGPAIVGALGWVFGLLIMVALVRTAARRFALVTLCVLCALPPMIYLFSMFGAPAGKLPPLAAPPAAAGSPNVVLIVLDTTRRDHLGAYGDDRGLTPFLDRFAAESVVYEQAITPGPWTVPSHASIFTGWYPVTHGCSQEHHLWLNDEFDTLAEMLGRAGYQTLALNSNFYLTRCNLLQGFEQSFYLDGPYDRLGIRRLANILGTPARWVDKGSAEAVNYLADWLDDGRDTSRPLFLMVNLFEGHRPYIPPRQERLERLPADVGAVEAAQFATTFEPIPLHLRHEQNEKAQALVSGLYEALIRYQDRRLEELMGLLEQRIDLDRSLIIITADHGENLGEAGRWEHIHAVNEDLIHVPLIIRYPGKTSAGRRIAGLCQTVDIVPTVFEAIGKQCPVSNLPGRTLTPDRFEPRAVAFAQVSPYTLHFPMIQMTRGFEQGLAGFNAHRRVIRTNTMKFIWSSDGRHELYDLNRDPGETQNLAESRQADAADLQRQLDEWWAAQPPYRPSEAAQSSNAQPLSKNALDQLRSLGYVGD